MKKHNLYTYKDWFDGKVTLQTTSWTFTATDKPVVVSWDNFAQNDIEKIQKKQEELFFERAALLLKTFQSTFRNGYKKSKMKDSYLEAEIQQCEDIMYADIPQVEFVTLNHWDFPLNTNDLLDMQRHVKRSILKGVEDGYDFIHSPNNKYQIQNKHNSFVYAQAIWEYCEWLKATFKFNQEPTEVQKSIGKLWFIVGVLFATGELNDLCIKYSAMGTPNFTAIAKHLENINLRPYLSESFNNASESDKNIFSKPNKISIIQEYCSANEIAVHSSFTDRLNTV